MIICNACFSHSRAESLIITMKGRRVVEEIIHCQKIVANVIETLISVRVRYTIPCYGTFLSFSSQKESPSLTKVGAGFVLDCLTIVEPEKLVDFVG